MADTHGGLRPRRREHRAVEDTSAPDRRDLAADTIIRAMRANTARNITRQMIMSGAIWGAIAADLRNTGRLGFNEPLTIERLSSVNLSALRSRLGQLDARECAFFDRFTSQRFFATHFTDAQLHGSAGAGDTMALLSRQKLAERNIDFPTQNTTERDIQAKADDGHVFFALECGEQAQKMESRFGGNLYRVPFDSPAFRQQAWGALDDLLEVAEQTNVMRRLPHLEYHQEEAIRSMIGPRIPRSANNADAFSDIFTGKDLIAAAGLSLIEKLRGVNHRLGGYDAQVDQLFNASTPQAFNALLGLFHRLEIRVPGHFFTRDFQHTQAATLALMQLTRDPDATLNSPTPDKLKAFVTFCRGSTEASLAQLHALHGLGIDAASIRGENGESLLHMLCDARLRLVDSAPSKNDVLSVIQALVVYGLDIDGRTTAGRTPLMMAMHDAELATALIDLGADVNARDHSGVTPLFRAVGPGVAELLVLRGADVNYRDDFGRNAMDFALHWFDPDHEVFQVLAAAGIHIGEATRDEILARVPEDLANAMPPVGAHPAYWMHFFQAVAQRT
ncbi:ankyrin repeat domain-containing protein [Roseateles sp. MS654]|uniref:ankyrin repeat domain-containing protein n=1 Tax=Roseateles sp. MS654 TaxID=3412685 RepID=UPI003C2DB761